MRLNRDEAHFLAMLFDATLNRVALQKANLSEFIVAEAYMGHNANPDDESEEALIEQLEVAEHEMICLRSRIRECFGL
jgi:hypothetical protein